MTAEASVARWYRLDRPAYRGVYCQQLEDDLDRYAELIVELAPAFIVEVGRADGGTTMFLADKLGKVRPDGLLVSIDILPPARIPPTLAKVFYVTADSVSPEAISRVRHPASGARGMVLLDGDHSSAQVAKELDLYAPFADYLIVEDTIMRHLGNQDGPHIALDAWLPDHPEFAPDPDPNITQHPGGWLRRI